MSAGQRDRLLDVVIAVGALPYLAQFLGAGGTVPPRLVTWTGALVKLAFLGLTAAWALRASRSFEAGDMARTAWRLLGAGFLGFFLGQLCLSVYQLFLGGTAPFPSVGDLFFVLAYPFLALALFAFARAYSDAGYAGASASTRRVIVVAAPALSALVAYVVLKPIVHAPASPLATALNIAYPVLDFVLLIPCALLVHTTLPLRGGAIGKAWMTLLAGLLVMCAADIAFAYFSALGQQSLDPLLNAMYVISYGLMARGVRRQHRLLTA